VTFQAIKNLRNIHSIRLKVGIESVNPYLYSGSIHTGKENANHTTTHKYPNSLKTIRYAELELRGKRPALRVRAKNPVSNVIAVA